MAERRPGAVDFAARLDGAEPRDVVVRVSEREMVIEGSDGRAPSLLRLDVIAEVATEGDAVHVTRVSGPPLHLRTPRALELDAVLVEASCALPELTHALRALGSSRAGTNSLRQREFFAPLLEARRRAEDAVTRRDIVGAFAVPRLLRAMEGQLASLAGSYSDPRAAAQRAFAAHVEFSTEPLREAIAALEAASAGAESPPPDARIASWRTWQRSLANVFAVADLCWRALEGPIGPAPEGTSNAPTTRRPRRTG